MTDSDTSHLFEIKLLTCRTGIGLDLFTLFFNVHLLCIWFYSDCYFLTSGTPSVEWVKPTTEIGGLFFAFLCFSVCLFSMMLSYWFLVLLCACIFLSI
jgi:hypothetical protein